MPTSAKQYLTGVAVAAAAVFLFALANWAIPPFPAWPVYLLITVLTSLVKLKLPGMRGTYSLSFLPVLFGVLHFSLAETLIAGSVGALVQSFARRKKQPTAVQTLFNIASLAVSTGACFLLARVLLATGLASYRAAVMALVACVYFAVNTVLVSGILALAEGTPFAEACEQWYLGPFPYYLVGATLVGLIPPSGQPPLAEACLLLLPLLFLIHFFLGLPERGSQAGRNDPATASINAAARRYLFGVLVLGLALLGMTAFRWQSDNLLRFAAYLALAAAASTLKVRLPGVAGTISVNFVLLLVAIAELSLPETVVMAAVAGAMQTIWKSQRRPLALQVLFNSAALSLSAALAYGVCRQVPEFAPAHSLAGLLTLATLVLYGANTVLVSAMLSLLKDEPLRNLWQRCYFWSCPYYLVGAAAAGLMIATGRAAGWLPSLLALPLMALVFVSYRAHLWPSASAKAHPVAIAE